MSSQSHYFVQLAEPREDGLTLLKIGFGAPADNDKNVVDAIAAIGALQLPGGRGLLFDGPSSIPVAVALAHAVAHLYQFVAVRDPKLSAFVVAISHTPDVRPGELIR